MTCDKLHLTNDEKQKHVTCSQAFNVVFHKAVEMAEACEDVKSRVNTLIDCVTYSTFNYISRGLFERDKLTFTAQLAFQVCICACLCRYQRECVFFVPDLCFSFFQLLLMSKEIDVRELNFLLRFNIDHNYVSPLDFLSNSAWSAIKVQTHTHSQTSYFWWRTEINHIINHYLLSLCVCSGDEFH